MINIDGVAEASKACQEIAWLKNHQGGWKVVTLGENAQLANWSGSKVPVQVSNPAPVITKIAPLQADPMRQKSSGDMLTRGRGANQRRSND